MALAVFRKPPACLSPSQTRRCPPVRCHPTNKKHQGFNVTHLLVSLTRVLQRGRCFCNPERALNMQAEGDEAQVTATMLQGACTTQPPAHPPPSSPQGEIRYKTFVTARTDLNL